MLIEKAAEIRQKAGRPDVLHSSGPRSASSASIESYTFPSGTSSPGRVSRFVNSPVQLILPLLQRLQRAILLQWDNDRFNPGHHG
jgi:hypothetical protein